MMVTSTRKSNHSLAEYGPLISLLKILATEASLRVLCGLLLALSLLIFPASASNSLKENLSFPYNPDWGGLPGMPAKPSAAQSDHQFGVLGQDDRYRVGDMTEYPFRTIGYLLARYGEDFSSCTATLIGKQHILTAAHCVYDRNSSSFPQELMFYPAFDIDEQPFGAFGVRKAYLLKEAMTNGGTFDATTDYAVAELVSTPGEFLGWLGLGVMTPVDKHVWQDVQNTLGRYSKDKQTSVIESLNRKYSDYGLRYIGYSGDKNGEPWGDECLYDIPSDGVAAYYCDDQGGASGSGLHDRDMFIRGVVSMTAHNDNARVSSSGDIYGSMHDMMNYAMAITNESGGRISAWVKSVTDSETFTKRFDDAKDVAPVFLVNSCKYPVYFAAKHRGVEGIWKAEGFWEFDPAERALAFLSTADHYFYYAVTEDQSLEWEGDAVHAELYGRSYGLRRKAIRNNSEELVLTCD